MGIALMALAFIPFFIAQISFIIGVVLMILGKKRDKRPHIN